MCSEGQRQHMEWGLLLKGKDWLGLASWKLGSNLQSGRCVSPSLLLSSFLVSSAFLGTADLFLISGDIAKPVLPNTALRTFSDISLGAKIVSDSQELSITGELLMGFERDKFV